MSGTPTELLLDRLCRRSFLRMWSNRSPYLQIGSHPKTRSKELCDLLVIFEEDVFIFSDKSIEWRDHEDLVVAWNRWYRAAVFESSRQLAGAERALRRQPKNVFGDVGCTRPLPVALPTSTTARFHRIAVAHGAAAACRSFHSGGSGSLMIVTDPRAPRDPFTVGHCQADGRLIHVFDEVSLELVLGNLDTIPEFRDYIRYKEELVAQGVHLCAAGEEDLLAVYLQGHHEAEPQRHGLGAIAGHNLVAIPEGEWDAFASGPAKAARDLANQVSYSWDELIDRFAKHAIDGTHHFTTSSGPQETERMLRLLNAEPRVKRRAYMQGVWDALKTIGTRPYRLWQMGQEDGEGTHYTFLALRQEKGESYEQYRIRRRGFLSACTSVSRLNRSVAGPCVGVAFSVPDADATDHSEDAMLIDDESWTLEMAEKARAFQEATGVLRTTKAVRRGVSEYPVEDEVTDREE